MRPMALSLTTTLLLGVCISDAAAMACRYEPPTSVLRIQCPPLKEYTTAQSIAIGEARKTLRAREPKSILLDVMDDAFALRSQCREIEIKP